MKMTPLPKWAGVVGSLAVIGHAITDTLNDGSFATLLQYIPKPVLTGATIVAALVMVLSHSLTGDGGKAHAAQDATDTTDAH